MHSVLIVSSIARGCEECISEMDNTNQPAWRAQRAHNSSSVDFPEPSMPIKYHADARESATPAAVLPRNESDSIGLNPLDDDDDDDDTLSATESTAANARRCSIQSSMCSRNSIGSVLPMSIKRFTCASCSSVVGTVTIAVSSSIS